MHASPTIDRRLPCRPGALRRRALVVFAALFASLGIADTASAWTAARTSSPVLYIDTRVTPKLLGAYAAYRITNDGAAVPDAWVGIGGFAGGVVSLGPGEDGVYRLGPMAAGQTKTAFFFLRASGGTARAQTHVISVYASRPPGTALFSQSFSLTRVTQTIQASPNRVITEVVNPSPPVLGGAFTMTVTGVTGTIGAAGILSFTPASYVDWPASALELTASQLTFTGGNTGTFGDRLSFTGMASASTAYTAVYTFRAVDATTALAPVSPVMYGSSGRPVKHTATGGFAALAPVAATTNTLALSKLASPSRLYGAGGTVTYTLRLTNSGTVPVTIDDLRDILPVSPARVTYVPGSSAFDGVGIPDPVASGATLTWSRLPTVPAGSVRDLTFQAGVPSTVGTYANTAVAHAGSAQIDATRTLGDNVPATVDVTVLSAADLAIATSVSAPAGPHRNGEPLTYTVTVTNAGPSTAVAPTVTHSLPAGAVLGSASAGCGESGGVVTCSLADMPSGTARSVTITVTPASAGIMTSTASVTSTTADPDVADNVTSLDTAISPVADVSVSKTVSDATPAIDSDVTFTVTVTNSGPDTAQDVAVADALPPGLTLVSATPSAGSYAVGVWMVGDLANGATASLAMVARVDDPTLVTNTATVSAATDDTDPTNNVDSAAVDVPDADLAVTNRVDDPAPALGANVVFTVTVTNNGPSGATGVRVADPLPPGLVFVSSDAGAAYDPATGVWTVGAIARGVTRTLRITVTVTSPAPQTTTATATSAGYDGNSADNAAAASVDVPEAAPPPSPPPPESADLRVVTSVSPSTVALGGTIDDTIVVTNHGPDAATNVQALVQLPSSLTFVSARASVGAYDAARFVWRIPSISNGGSAALVVTVRAAAPGPVMITAQIVASDQPGPDGPFSAALAGMGPGVTAVTVVVTGAAPAPTRLALTKRGPKVVTTGGVARFTIVVRNSGKVPATNVVMSDCIPLGLSLSRRVGAERLRKNGRFGWRLGTLRPGESRVARVALRADRGTRGLRGCTAIASAANAPTVRARARVRVVAGARASVGAAVTG